MKDSSCCLYTRTNPLFIIILLAGVFVSAYLIFQRFPAATHQFAGGSTINTIAARIPPPSGYSLLPVSDGSFKKWLIQLPLKSGRPPVLLFDGRRKSNQNAHHAVLDIDVGDRDLQQCADAAIRLRAEYLYSIGDFKAIHFNFTSGDRADFTRWARGDRPTVRGNKVSWVTTAKEDYSYANFRRYLDCVFAYAGTLSLSAELQIVSNIKEMQIGDLFIRGGSPGHCVVVVNMAQSADGDRRLFLLAQSYMPAQEVHILKNPSNPSLSPWYQLDFGETLVTPEWSFQRTELMRFPAASNTSSGGDA